MWFGSLSEAIVEVVYVCGTCHLLAVKLNKKTFKQKCFRNYFPKFCHLDFNSEIPQNYQKRKRYINIHKLSGDCLGEGGVSRPGGQGSNVYVLCAEPNEHKHLRPGNRPGGLVTEKLFMCKMLPPSFLQSESCANFSSCRCKSQCEFLSEFRCEFLRSAVACLGRCK